MKSFLLTSITCFLLTLAAIGQTDATAERLRAKAKATNSHKDVLINYDKFKDRTAVITKPENLITGKESFAAGLYDSLSRGPYGSGRSSGFPTALLISAGFYFKGEELATPTKYYLVFTSASSTFLFLKGDRNVYFLFDGERLELIPVDSDYDIGGRSVGEQLGYEIQRSDLEKIVAAKTVELKIGQVPRKLKPDVLGRFKKLIDLVP